MRLRRVFAAGFFGALVLGAAASARPVLDVNGPMELPPASFKGRQYVDSAGCVFVRAGFGEAVRWVARVSRDRKHICGYKPTFGGDQPALDVAKTAPVAPAAPATPKAAPPVVAKTTTAVGTVIPAPSARVVATAAGKPTIGDPIPLWPVAPARVTAIPAPAARAPYSGNPAAYSAPLRSPLALPTSGYVSPYAVTGFAPGAPAPRASAPVGPSEPAQGACANLSAVAQKYMRSGNGLAVRCGPQTVGPVSENTVPMTRTRQAAKLTAVIVATKVPVNGYTPAFEDGRLNPYRGPQTLEGDLQMGQIWTRQLPARLVTSDTPAHQRITASYLKTRQQQLVARVSGKSLAGSASKGRFVQIGTFGQVANADSAKAKLQGMGVPVSASVLTRGAKRLSVVLAGPFATPQAATDALVRLRAAGFGDAFLR